MSFTIFSIALIMVFAVIATIEIYQGLKKGFFKSAVAFGMALVCMLISVVLSPLLSELLVSSVLCLSTTLLLCSVFPPSPSLLSLPQAVIPNDMTIANKSATILLFFIFFPFPKKTRPPRRRAREKTRFRSRSLKCPRTVSLHATVSIPADALSLGRSRQWLLLRSCPAFPYPCPKMGSCAH